jgi:integrase
MRSPSAVEDDILKVNPAQYRAKRRKRLDTISLQERRESIRTMNDRQLADFLEAAATKVPITYFTSFFLMARTGLRPGEAAGLEPDDLNLQERKIHVERAISAGEVGSTKTGERRVVDLSEKLCEILRDYLVWREKETMRRGWRGLPRWLFFNDAGGFVDESRVRKNYAKALKAAKMSGFRLYDLRHTYASMLLARGVPITYVSAQLGHAKPTTTLQWYAHFLPTPESQRFADLLDEDPPEGEARKRVGTTVGTNEPFPDPGTEGAAEKRREIRRLKNGPREIRTPDPLIKSQLL